MPFLVSAAAAAPPAVSAVQPAQDDLARGRALRLAGQARQALPYLHRAAQVHADDADAWLELGLAEAQTHAFDAADRALTQAAALAPGYLDVAVARARIAWFRGDLDEARRRLAPALQRAPDNPDVRYLSTRLDAAARERAAGAWRLDAAVTQARLSEDLPNATDAVLALSRRLSDGTSLGGSLEEVRQFRQSDRYIELLAGRRFGYLALGGAPDAKFRPRSAVRGGLTARAQPLGAGWRAQFGLDLGWARYPVGDVRTLAPGLTLLRGDQLALAARWIEVLDERDQRRGGYALTGDWRVGSLLRLRAGWSSAPESDVGVTMKVRAASVGLAVDVSPGATLRLGYAHEMRQAYDRDELTVGFGRRF